MRIVGGLRSHLNANQGNIRVNIPSAFVFFLISPPWFSLRFLIPTPIALVLLNRFMNKLISPRRHKSDPDWTISVSRSDQINRDNSTRPPRVSAPIEGNGRARGQGRRYPQESSRNLIVWRYLRPQIWQTDDKLVVRLPACEKAQRSIKGARSIPFRQFNPNVPPGGGEKKDIAITEGFARFRARRGHSRGPRFADLTSAGGEGGAPLITLLPPPSRPMLPRA